MDTARPLRPALLTPLVVLALAAGLGSAQAQLMLPGASDPTPSGAPASSASAPVRHAPAGPAQVAPARALSEESLVGRTLFLNGTRGRIVVDRKDANALRLQFIATGDKISRPGEACGVEFGGGQSLEAVRVGRPDGVLRLRLEFPACQVSLDVLEGAVLVGGVEGACRFQEADCAVDPRGMWGPPASQLEGQLKAIETDRSIADKTVRQNFKALLSRTKGKQEIKTVAAEQAGFTSERETVCRDYAREAVHGFCSTRFTEWRAASLAARVNKLDGKPEESLLAQARPKPKAKPRETAAVAGAPAPLPQGPQPVAPRPAPPPSQPNFFERLFR